MVLTPFTNTSVPSLFCSFVVISLTTNLFQPTLTGPVNLIRAWCRISLTTETMVALECHLLVNSSWESCTGLKEAKRAWFGSTPLLNTPALLRRGRQIVIPASSLELPQVSVPQPPRSAFSSTAPPRVLQSPCSEKSSWYYDVSILFYADLIFNNISRYRSVA